MKLPEVEYRASELREISALASKVQSAHGEYPPTTWGAYFVTELFLKFAVHLKSVVRLLPDKSYRTVDVSALAAIARVVIESREAIIYFTQRGLSAEEKSFRMALYQYHYSKEYSVVLNRLGFDDLNFFSDWNERSLRGNRRQLTSDKYFQQLKPKEQKMLLSGRKAYYWRGNKPAPKFISADHESALYKLLSNHIHSSPLGAAGNFGSKAPLGRDHVAFFAIEVLVMYSASILQEFLAYRWKLGQSLDMHEKQFLKRALKNNCIEKWIEQANDA